MSFEPGLQPTHCPISGKCYWFCFQSDRLMVFSNGTDAEIPLVKDLGELNLEIVRTQFIGMLDITPCYSVELSDTMAWPSGTSFYNLIELFSRVDEDIYKAAVYAKQIVAWDREHQYCGSCGGKTDLVQDERARKCESCGILSFPRITPAIMVAVLKDKQILLARNSTFPNGFYSVLAGFVEPGERLEECVVREVKEEVGLSIKNIRYFNSQPWPFPNSLMIAFIADYAGGEVAVDGKEIIEAGWYTSDQMPKCPTGSLSVAGKLIDWFKAH